MGYIKLNEKRKTSWSKTDTLYRVIIPTWFYAISGCASFVTAFRMNFDVLDDKVIMGMLAGGLALGYVSNKACSFVTDHFSEEKKMQQDLMGYIYLDEMKFDSITKSGGYKLLEDQLITLSEGEGEKDFENFISSYVGKLGYFNVKHKLLLSYTKPKLVS